MKISDTSYILFMHTGINDWQRKIIYNIYLKKISIRLHISMLLALAIAFGFMIIPMGLLIVKNFQIQIPTYINIALILSAIVAIVLFLIYWRYSLRQAAVEEELIEYYGEYPKELEQIIIKNTDLLMNGRCLPADYYQAEQNILQKK